MKRAQPCQVTVVLVAARAAAERWLARYGFDVTGALLLRATTILLSALAELGLPGEVGAAGADDWVAATDHVRDLAESTLCRHFFPDQDAY